MAKIQREVHYHRYQSIEIYGYSMDTRSFCRCPYAPVGSLIHVGSLILINLFNLINLAPVHVG